MFNINKNKRDGILIFVLVFAFIVMVLFCIHHIIIYRENVANQKKVQELEMEQMRIKLQQLQEKKCTETQSREE